MTDEERCHISILMKRIILALAKHHPKDFPPEECPECYLAIGSVFVAALKLDKETRKEEPCPTTAVH